MKNILNNFSVIDPCANTPCQNGGTCSIDNLVDPEGYTCACLNGYTGATCGTGKYISFLLILLIMLLL